MLEKKYRSHFKKIFIVTAAALVLFSLTLLINDAKAPFVRPFFTKQIDSSCPYYKDFLGRVYYRYSYDPRSLFVVGSSEKKIQYHWHRVKGINDKDFKIEKVLQETKVDSRTETQKTCIASDGNSLVYNNYVFAGADLETFEVLENSFYKDKNTVYFSNGRVVPEADHQTFEILTTNECPNSYPPFARDDKQIFYANNIVEQADRDTFEIICVENGVRGKDKNHTYLDTRIEN